ncbi:MAG: hypothetical protein LW823_03185 [Rickettsiales bacterium]|jgi:hypothetical protein|nr:hypothetical protein [Rickettsiales bacterium]
MINSGEKAPSAQEQVGIISKILKVASIPAGAATGYYFGAASISDSTYNRLKRNSVLAAKYDPERPAAVLIKSMKPISEKFNDAASAISNNNTEQASKILSETIPELDKIVVKEINQHMKSAGLGPIWKKWKFVHASDKNRALLDAFTAAGITIGAILAVSNSRTLSAMFTGNDKETSR